MTSESDISGSWFLHFCGAGKHIPQLVHILVPSENEFWAREDLLLSTFMSGFQMDSSDCSSKTWMQWRCSFLADKRRPRRDYSKAFDSLPQYWCDMPESARSNQRLIRLCLKSNKTMYRCSPLDMPFNFAIPTPLRILNCAKLTTF